MIMLETIIKRTLRNKKLENRDKLEWLETLVYYSVEQEKIGNKKRSYTITSEKKGIHGRVEI